MLSPWQSVERCMRRSFVWAGRAPRSELWWFVLIVWIVTWALGALATGQGLIDR